MSITSTVFVVTFLVSLCARCEDEIPNVISNCFIQTKIEMEIRCAGNFNLSQILFEQRQLQDSREPNWYPIYFKALEIFDSDIEKIDESLMQLHGFTFETIFIKNAPKLRSITPKALVELKDKLTDFRALRTGLPQYNDFGNDPHKNENPFDNFKKLSAVYIGEQSRCPSDETLLFPCSCEFGAQSRKFDGNGRHTLTYSSSDIFNDITEVICRNDVTGDELKEMFRNISQSDHEPKHFDVLIILKAKSLTNIPSNVFSNVTFTTIWMLNVDNLKSIHAKAFVNTNDDRTARSIQILDIATANFTAASSTEVDDLFYALSTLTNMRHLRLEMCGIPYIPSHAFAPENPQKQLNNLRYLSLSEDRYNHKTGIKSVGSYAFSGAPQLVVLAVQRNFIEEFNSFAFAFNESSNSPLTIYIGANPFNATYGLKPNAFSGTQRPTRIDFFRNNWLERGVDFIPENVFRPFIEENSENYFGSVSDEVWCDCNTQWMFDSVGNLKESIENGLRTELRREKVSIQCKPDSSFECLPNCLTFRANGLIHCGGNRQFDVKSTFLQLGHSSGTEKIDKLLFSSKEIQQLPLNAFGDFQFKAIRLEGCWNLSSIHPNAFGASTETVESFSARNTNLTHYPNFASFPKLVEIRLDDDHSFSLNSSNFDFSESIIGSRLHPEEINVFLSGGIFNPKTFTKLNNETAVNLNIGDVSDCEGKQCFRKCKSISSLFAEETVKTFLAANSENTIQTNCYLECSCGLKWMCKSWNDIQARISLLKKRYGSEFFCVPEGSRSFDVSKFKYGKYFKKNCCNKKSTYQFIDERIKN